MTTKIGKPKGLPHTGGKPKSKQEYTCANCGKVFEEVPSKRTRETACCSAACGAVCRERALGHEPPIIKECCFEGCAVQVKRFVSKGSKEFTGNVFCSRAHYLAWRSGKTLGEIREVRQPAKAAR